jgi:hypothetical protein
MFIFLTSECVDVSGLVLDSGENITYAIPIMEFKIETARAKRLDIAGEQLNNYLKDLLAQRGPFLSFHLLLFHLRKCYYCCIHSIKLISLVWFVILRLCIHGVRRTRNC